MFVHLSLKDIVRAKGGSIRDKEITGNSFHLNGYCLTDKHAQAVDKCQFEQILFRYVPSQPSNDGLMPSNAMSGHCGPCYHAGTFMETRRTHN